MTITVVYYPRVKITDSKSVSFSKLTFEFKVLSITVP